ncbi:hypothetical protein HMPREF9318_00839 [Streptococcus urinalis FB127-CNA-2]|uniref:ABC transporter, ATP-binding protein n=1 Tax=Streptococcus urinalis 2285-97 TaxID=764291 RepID=G5KHX3_9STRE|nr:SPJ_0845 family protein [Streptococcus urinalis]EHJ57657.1 ABC transporter, ATP-binding protein [Streptococcus urinalis 2285-97]EKS22641.1 hypothetical protein HMPREF9318_00839 [Streptococcus urinalis FB127-CNA-2]VEF32410.1 Uncharacterised protein [Streptococcus urinalis]
MAITYKRKDDLEKMLGSFAKLPEMSNVNVPETKTTDTDIKNNSQKDNN